MRDTWSGAELNQLSLAKMSWPPADSQTYEQSSDPIYYVSNKCFLLTATKFFMSLFT